MTRRYSPLGRLSILFALLALLGACAMPRGAATRTELLSAEQTAAADMQVVAVTRQSLPALARWSPPDAPATRWLPRSRGPKSTVIRPGDRLDLTIWDSDSNSLFTAPEQKRVAMERLRVSPTGELFVPYVGKVVVAGLTPDQARETIQQELGRVIASAQVQLSMAPGRMNAVDLVGGVARPGSYPLPDRDYTVLNLISAGGGAAPDLRNPWVRLVREGRTYRIPLRRIYAEPGLDTTLRGGDKVIVEPEERHFVALGATGTEQLIPFPRDTVSALEALSLIGGLADASADPKGVLILREYPPSAVQADPAGQTPDPADPGPAPRRQRVVFTIDLTTADGLFSARNFQIRPNDLVLVTDAPGGLLKKAVSLLGSVVGVANRL